MGHYVARRFSNRLCPNPKLSNPARNNSRSPRITSIRNQKSDGVSASRFTAQCAGFRSVCQRVTVVFRAKFVARNRRPSSSPDCGNRCTSTVTGESNVAARQTIKALKGEWRLLNKYTRRVSYTEPLSEHFQIANAKVPPLIEPVNSPDSDRFLR